MLDVILLRLRDTETLQKGQIFQGVNVKYYLLHKVSLKFLVLSSPMHHDKSVTATCKCTAALPLREEYLT